MSAFADESRGGLVFLPRLPAGRQGRQAPESTVNTNPCLSLPSSFKKNKKRYSI